MHLPLHPTTAPIPASTHDVLTGAIPADAAVGTLEKAIVVPGDYTGACVRLCIAPGRHSQSDCLKGAHMVSPQPGRPH
jgi:hypothetical protein